MPTLAFANNPVTFGEAVLLGVGKDVVGLDMVEAMAVLGRSLAFQLVWINGGADEISVNVAELVVLPVSRWESVKIVGMGMLLEYTQE